MKEQLKEMTLLMMYLQSWNEKVEELDVIRAWKTYDFYTLDELGSQGMISNSKKAKSVVISENGVAEAKKLMEKYGISRD